MTQTDAKGDLQHYLQNAREALVWKLDGLSEYSVRRPLTPTGTNLLGLVKHLSSVELLYFVFAFGRSIDDPPAWFGPDVAPNTDKWATSAESRDLIVGTYKRAWQHSDATILSVELEAKGFVPWLPNDQMSLHGVLVHVLAETERHAGHADIVRELIDGAVGRMPGNEQMAPGAEGELATRDTAWWETYRSGVELAAKQADQ